MAESEEEMHLSAKECQDRINQFVEITNTDEAEAQSVLQDNRWNVEVNQKIRTKTVFCNTH